MITVDVTPAPAIEALLAFLADTIAGDWPALVTALDTLPDTSNLETAAAGLRSTSHPQGVAAADFIATRLQPFWNEAADAYAAAAKRLAENVDAHPRADLGALFGFDVAIDLQHLGLRRRTGAVRRIAPNRLAMIRLSPSGFNPDHLWHLTPAADGQYVVHLPVHDPALAAQCRSFLQPYSKQLGPKQIASAPAVIPAAAARPSPAQIFRALGDASRFAMAELLARDELTGAELSRRLGLSTPAITHHLNELRRAGLIDERRQGTAIHLTLRRPVFEDLTAMSLGHLFGKRPASTPQRSRRKRVAGKLGGKP